MNKKRVHSCLFPSFSDFEDEIAVSVFFSGCNMRCRMCFNARVVVEPPKMTLEEVLAFIESQVPLATAVVLLGGEPLVHPVEVLEEFLERVRDMGLKTKLFTNGTFYEKLVRLMPLLDRVSLDVKHRLNLECYQRVSPLFTNEMLDNIIQSAEFLRRFFPQRSEFRITVCKPIHTCEDLESLKRDFPGLIVQSYEKTDGQLFKDFELEVLRCE